LPGLSDSQLFDKSYIDGHGQFHIEPVWRIAASIHTPWCNEHWQFLRLFYPMLAALFRMISSGIV
jgi:hypothetical protein